MLLDIHKKKKNKPLCVVYGAPGVRKHQLSATQRNVDKEIDGTIDRLEAELTAKGLPLVFCCVNEYKSTKISEALLRSIGGSALAQDKQAGLRLT